MIDAALPVDTRIFHVGTLGMVLEPMATTMERLVASAPDDCSCCWTRTAGPRVTPDRAAYLRRLARMVAGPTW